MAVEQMGVDALMDVGPYPVQDVPMLTMWAEFLRLAVMDARGTGGRACIAERDAARRYMLSDSCSLLSFRGLCSVFGIDPDAALEREMPRWAVKTVVPKVVRVERRGRPTKAALAMKAAA